MIAVITKGPDPESDYFNRPLCLQELRWAVEAGVQIQPVINIDDKKRIGEFMAGAPEDLQFLGGIVCLQGSLSPGQQVTQHYTHRPIFLRRSSTQSPYTNITQQYTLHGH